MAATSSLRQVLTGLQDYPALARAISDPAAPTAQKRQLLADVFGAPGPDGAALDEMVNRSWGSPAELLEWVEKTAVAQAWTQAQSEGTLGVAIDEVFGFGQLVLRDHDVRAAVTDRNVPRARRQDLVRAMVSGRITSSAQEVILTAVASEHGTIDDALHTHLCAGAEIAGARLAAVTVAMPMGAEQKERLAAALATRLGSPVIVEEIVDPTVLGGVRVECGSEVIDSTLAARLASVRRDFA